MEKIRVGFGLCGSFCTYSAVLPQMEAMVAAGWEVTPLMSAFAAATDTRFGKANEFLKKMQEICGRPVITTIEAAEPIGPQGLLDILILAPCTGNTLGKLACGITDTSVTMAAKAHLRNQRPLLLGVSTNDALGGSAKNIGLLMQAKNVYFIPMRQDDPSEKPCSMVADFSQTLAAAQAALAGKQLQPVLF